MSQIIAIKKKDKKPSVKKPFGPVYPTYDPEVEGYGTPEKWRALFEKRVNFCILTEQDKKVNDDVLATLREVFKKKDKKALQKEYHKLMMKWHPDVEGGSLVKAQLINDTYFELVDRLS